VRTPPAHGHTRACARPTRCRLASALGLILLAATLITGCGGRSSDASTAGASASGFAGTALTPIKIAPGLALHNYLGDRVNLESYRGKAVLVTFLYTHCIDVCPLIAANLAAALQRLGPEASKVQVIAVSVDPRGDTRTTVTAFLRLHHMTGRMKYLTGTASQLAPVWRAWHVAAMRNPTSRKLVTHSSVTYGISASGKLVTLYGPTFQPAQIVHDIPKLIAT
jgi:protein SCO1/2